MRICSTFSLYRFVFLTDTEFSSLISDLNKNSELKNKINFIFDKINNIKSNKISITEDKINAIYDILMDL